MSGCFCVAGFMDKGGRRHPPPRTPDKCNLAFGEEGRCQTTIVGRVVYIKSLDRAIRMYGLSRVPVGV